jgi:peptide/nickel transport system ATP-binding protein
MSQEFFLEVSRLGKDFAPVAFARGPVVRAVQDVSFNIKRGEVVGLVGESGSGKTTIGRMVAQLIEPTAGSIRFEGSETTSLTRRELRSLHARVQYIFQDPFASLSPRMTVGEILTEGLDIQRIGRKSCPGPRLGRPAAGCDFPLPARIFRRPAPAHRYRPGADACARADRRR